MGKISNKIKKSCMVVCALINASMPILLLSGLPIPLVVIVCGNILASICMVGLTQSHNIEEIITDVRSNRTDSSTDMSSNEPA